MRLRPMRSRVGKFEGGAAQVREVRERVMEQGEEGIRRAPEAEPIDIQARADRGEEEWRKLKEQYWSGCMGIFPMRTDNPCLGMTEEEFKAYIHTRRAEFDKKYAGKGGLL